MWKNTGNFTRSRSSVIIMYRYEIKIIIFIIWVIKKSPTRHTPSSASNKQIYLFVDVSTERSEYCKFCVCVVFVKRYSNFFHFLPAPGRGAADDGDAHSQKPPRASERLPLASRRRHHLWHQPRFGHVYRQVIRRLCMRSDQFAMWWRGAFDSFITQPKQAGLIF